MNINELIKNNNLVEYDELLTYLILIKTKFYVKFYNDILSNNLQIPDVLLTVDQISLCKDLFDDVFKKL